MSRYVEIMDTTLRDGEQTNNVSFSPAEKLHIASFLLEKLNLDRIEVASARVSIGEEKAVKKITDWAKSAEDRISKNKSPSQKGYLNRIEVLGFIDGKVSVDWLHKCGVKCLNLLAKGSLEHLKKQIQKTPKEHFQNIAKVVEYANSKNIRVNIYLEDWSNGYFGSRDYVYEMLSTLQEYPIQRFMLPDTLGVLYPNQVHEAFTKCIQEFPKLHFDFHPHNDYGFGTINVLEAIRAGAKGVHTTINCLGERTGNASLAEVVSGINDHLKHQCGIIEKNLYPIAKIVETFSGKRIADNTPIIGADVFTQTAGIHADGDKKGNLYQSRLQPKRFGRKRLYALGKLSGKASLSHNLEELDIHLSPENKKKVLEKIIELGDQKELVHKEDIPFIISSVLKKDFQKIIHFTHISVNSSLNLKPVCSMQIQYNRKEYQYTADGDGGYDAFMNAIQKWSKENKIELPSLVDYEVRIPPGGRTSALVECKITWSISKKTKNYNRKELITRGFHSDQVLSAIEATEKMLNIILNEKSL